MAYHDSCEESPNETQAKIMRHQHLAEKAESLQGVLEAGRSLNIRSPLGKKRIRWIALVDQIEANLQSLLADLRTDADISHAHIQATEEILAIVKHQLGVIEGFEWTQD